MKLIDHLFRAPSITISRTSKLLDITHAAAAHNVRKLVEAGILAERTGRKRDQIFVAMDILRIVEDAKGTRAPTKHS